MAELRDSAITWEKIAVDPLLPSRGSTPATSHGGDEDTGHTEGIRSLHKPGSLAGVV